MSHSNQSLTSYSILSPLLQRVETAAAGQLLSPAPRRAASLLEESSSSCTSTWPQHLLLLALHFSYEFHGRWFGFSTLEQTKVHALRISAVPPGRNLHWFEHDCAGRFPHVPEAKAEVEFKNKTFQNESRWPATFGSFSIHHTSSYFRWSRLLVVP